MSVSGMLFVLCICLRTGDTTETSNAEGSLKSPDYGALIDDYLEARVITPTWVVDLFEQGDTSGMNLDLSWTALPQGVEIAVNGHAINTARLLTANPIWGTSCDSLNFANVVKQVKVYQEQSLLGFELRREPCSGLACGVCYHVVYDLKTQQTSCFGRFRSGLPLDLYHLNSDETVDYLSTTFFGRNASGIDTTEYVLNSQLKNGRFAPYVNADGHGYWFKHIYPGWYSELSYESLEEMWFEPIRSQ